tara:strand:- start:189 stop:728 length:540 start_codon:yes stop_codon:yes gene_type:complete
MGWPSFLTGTIRIDKESINQFLLDTSSTLEQEDYWWLVQDIKHQLDPAVLTNLRVMGRYPPPPPPNMDMEGGKVSIVDDGLKFESVFTKNNRWKVVLDAFVKYKDKSTFDILAYRNYGTISGFWLLSPADCRFFGDENGNCGDVLKSLMESFSYDDSITTMNDACMEAINGLEEKLNSQ